MEEIERRRIFASCTSFLSGHRPVSVREQLAALGDAVGGEELADVYGTGSLIEDFERHVAAIIRCQYTYTLQNNMVGNRVKARIRHTKSHSHLTSVE